MTIGCSYAGKQPFAKRMQRLTIAGPIHKGAAPWRYCFSAMFLVLGWPAVNC
jgi:hypothetical protein